MKEITKFGRGFRYAYEGLKYALSTQRNMKFHFFVAFFVLLIGLVIELSKVEILFLLLVITLVIVTELINTALEKTVDLAMPDRHPLAKIAKDVAAASVLVTAVFAAVTGMIIFYEPLDQLIGHVRKNAEFSPGIIWILIALVAVTVIVIQTRFHAKKQEIRPSLLSAIAFSMASFVMMVATKTIVILLCYSLALLVMMVLYEKKSRSLLSLLFGALLGFLVTMMGYTIIQHL